MATGVARAGVPKHFDTLFRFGRTGNLSDWQLVQRVIDERDSADQPAFTLIVERHGPMVMRICRQILGDSHDAQDAFQATFLVLARKAVSLRKADSLASWLHGVAHRVASRARADAVRRRNLEQRSDSIRAARLPHHASSAESWPELHDEIARLPQHYRERRQQNHLPRHRLPWMSV